MSNQPLISENNAQVGIRATASQARTLEHDMAHLLGAEALHLEYPTRVVFDAVTLGIAEGDRIGIVGRNGDGKSSLLGMLAGRIEPDSGRVTRRGGVRLGVLDQSDTLNDAETVGHAIVGERLEHEWAGDARVRDVISGLVPDLGWDTLIGTLSGGQRRRVALAALLVGDWDIIALDEPTNHLDVEGIAWLAGHLRTRWAKNAGGLLVITHDRWFLDEVCTATWEVHDRIVEPFEGGYAAYVLQRVERDRQAAAVEAKRQNLMTKELAWLRRGAPARTSKPKFRIEAANQLIENVPPPRDRLELSRLAVARLGKDVVDLLEVSVSFDNRAVLRGIEWRIAPGERTAILGRNGAGKSTLLGLIAGTVEPSSGRVKRGKTVRLGVLDQQFHQLEAIASDRVREVLARHKTSYVIDGKELSSAQLLERLGFSREHLSARVGELSGGQKRRLQLLLVLLDEPNVMILDEPSNDVDVDFLAAMEDLLDSWPGTLIVVSHDRYLVERVTDQQYAILPDAEGVGRLRHLPGGMDEYLRLAAAGRTNVAGNAQAMNASGGLPTQSKGASGTVSAQVSGDARDATASMAPAASGGAVGSSASNSPAASSSPAGSSATLNDADTPPTTTAPQARPASVRPGSAEERAARKELSSLERKLERTTARIASLHESLATHDQSDYEGVGRLAEELRETEAEASTLEDRWLELSEILD